MAVLVLRATIPCIGPVKEGYEPTVAINLENAHSSSPETVQWLRRLCGRGGSLDCSINYPWLRRRSWLHRLCGCSDSVAAKVIMAAVPIWTTVSNTNHSYGDWTPGWFKNA